MKLFYRQFGQGAPVIILHGLFGLSDNWVSIAKRIATQFAVYIPDMRNHGQSPHSPEMNYQVMTLDLLEFMEEHKLENAILIGHSMGGKVAMDFALNHPAALSRLVIIDISPRSYPARSLHSNIISAMLSISLQELNSRSQVEIQLRRSIPDMRIRQMILKNLFYESPQSLAWRLNLDAIHNNLGLMFEGIAPGRTFTKPTLFIRGGSSDYITLNDGSLISKMFPFSDIKTIPSASHWLQADAPEELCLLLSVFLGKEFALDQ